MNITAVSKSDGSVDLTGKQGATWTFTVTANQPAGTPMNLTGYLGRGQIRKAYDSASVTKSFTVTNTAPTTGVVSVSMSASDTAGIPCGKAITDTASAYVYDIEIYTGAPETVIRLLEGKLFIDAEVTR